MIIDIDKKYLHSGFLSALWLLVSLSNKSFL